MQKCSNCGFENKDMNQFCTSCGNKLIKDNSTNNNPEYIKFKEIEGICNQRHKRDLIVNKWVHHESWVNEYYVFSNSSYVLYHSLDTDAITLLDRSKGYLFSVIPQSNNEPFYTMAKNKYPDVNSLIELIKNDVINGHMPISDFFTKINKNYYYNHCNEFPDYFTIESNYILTNYNNTNSRKHKRHGYNNTNAHKKKDETNEFLEKLFETWKNRDPNEPPLNLEMFECPYCGEYVDIYYLYDKCPHCHEIFLGDEWKGNEVY